MVIELKLQLQGKKIKAFGEKLSNKQLALRQMMDDVNLYLASSMIAHRDGYYIHTKPKHIKHANESIRTPPDC